VTSATGAAPVVIGKSLGSLAAPLAADRGLAAVWFTPLLTDELVVAALWRATGPCLLVGSITDQFWDGQAARSLTPDIVEVEAADHGMSLRIDWPPRQPCWARSARLWRASSIRSCGRTIVRAAGPGRPLARCTSFLVYLQAGGGDESLQCVPGDAEGLQPPTRG